MLFKFDNIVQKYPEPPIHGILHIGAHNCEELPMYKRCGVPEDKIIWVEANPDIAKRHKGVKNFVCCDKSEGISTLNIANNGQSSSILELGTHATSYPGIRYIGKVEVPNKRIDTMYEEDGISPNFANFLNIDIQGAELLALRGMGNILENFDFVYLEVNREYVYKDNALVTEIDEYLEKFNFRRVETVWTDKNWGDSLYKKF